mgnify:FL=1
MQINRNYQNIKETYLFTNVAAKARAYSEEHPEADVIRLSIGDVTRPLPPVVVEAMVRAAEEMGNAGTFRGYGPEQGYDFLRQEVALYYASFGVRVGVDEILISDGAKSDLGNILDIFGEDNVALVPDPVYPVYVDTNLMAGRRIVYLQGNEENGFLPMPHEDMVGDIIYLCSPNNPTGAVYNRAQLKEWVDFANKNDAVILFDAAYEAFVSEGDLPRSVFEIEGARTCAIEFCSLSKTAGFTGTRCGYTVVPDELVRGGVQLRRMWLRRQTTKFNGVSYPVQRAAAAALTAEGVEACRENIAYYKENARMIADMLTRRGIVFTGGKNSPYIWMKCPGGMRSWEFFDVVLERANVVGTPGAGFGENGEGWFRLTAFGDRDRTATAVERLEKLLTELEAQG